MGGKVFPGLLFILFQSLFEDWLKVWSGGTREGRLES